MSLPALSQRLLVAQSIVADPSQASYATYDGMSGVQAAALTPGVASVSCEKLGLLESTHHINWSAGVVAGEVVIEVADEPSYTGPWALVQTFNFVDANASAPRQDYARVQGSYAAYRHRITVPIQGGTVTTKIVAAT